MNKNLNIKEKIPPIQKIKIPLAIFTILFLISIIGVVLVHGFNKPKIKMNKSSAKENDDEIIGVTSKPNYFDESYDKSKNKKKSEDFVDSNEAIAEDSYLDEKIETPNNGKYMYDQNSEIVEESEDERIYKEFVLKYEEDRVEKRLRARNSQIDLYKPDKPKDSLLKQNSLSQNNLNYPIKSNTQINNQYEMQNSQSRKREFLRKSKHSSFANSYDSEYADNYMLKAGGIIPTVLISGVNSDLPSDVIAQVREDVYDTVSGNYLLLPKGARLIGTYDSGITYGQKRLLLIWQRIVFPNGKSIGLDNFNGVDMSGYAGVTGKVDNHFSKLLQAVVLSSVLGAGTAILTKDDNSKTTSWQEGAGNGAGKSILEIGSKIADKTLNIQPTILVRQGSRMNVMINSDLKLTPYRR